MVFHNPCKCLNVALQTFFQICLILKKEFASSCDQDGEQELTLRYSQGQDDRVLWGRGLLHLRAGCRPLSSSSSGCSRACTGDQGAGVCVAALFLARQGGAGSVLLAGCSGTGLGLVVKPPRALCLRGSSSSSSSSSGDAAGGVRDTVGVSGVGAVLHHAVWAHRGVHSGAEVEGGAAKMGGGREARGVVGLPPVT